jgi:hypothetical protein
MTGSLGVGYADERAKVPASGRGMCAGELQQGRVPFIRCIGCVYTASRPRRPSGGCGRRNRRGESEQEERSGGRGARGAGRRAPSTNMSAGKPPPAGIVCGACGSTPQQARGMLRPRAQRAAWPFVRGSAGQSFVARVDAARPDGAAA